MIRLHMRRVAAFSGVLIVTMATSAQSESAAPPTSEEFAAILMEAIESRSFTSTTTETQWMAVRAADPQAWHDGTWLSRITCETTYDSDALFIEAEDQIRERPAEMVSPLRICRHDGRVLQWIPDHDGSIDLTVRNDLSHPGFVEFPLWFDRAIDRFPGQMPPVIAAIAGGNVISIDGDGDTMRCRFFRLEREQFHTVVVLDRATKRLKEVHHLLAARPDAAPGKEFDDRLLQRYTFRVLAWDDYGDELSLPSLARVETQHRRKHTDDWSWNCYEYERLSASNIEPGSLADCTPETPTGTRVNDRTAMINYEIGSSLLLVDGSRYRLKHPIKELITGNLDELLDDAELDSRRDPAADRQLDTAALESETLASADQSTASNRLLVILGAVAAGLGCALIVIALQRRGNADRGSPT